MQQQSYETDPNSGSIPAIIGPRDVEAEMNMHIPPDVLGRGVEAVVAYIAPETYNVTMGMSTPEEDMRNILIHIKNLLKMDKVIQLRLGRSLFWIKAQKSWNLATGGAAYDSFAEFIHNVLEGVELGKVDEWIQFYLTFVECIKAGVSPEQLFLPVVFDRQKLGMIYHNMKTLQQNINTERKILGEGPELQQVRDEKQEKAQEEIARIALMDKNMSYSPPDPGIHAPILQPVSLFCRGHIQSDKIIVTTEIPLTYATFRAIDHGKYQCSFQVPGIEGTLDWQELSVYLKEKDLIAGNIEDEDEADEVELDL